MYNIRHEIRKFEMDDSESLSALNEIINNPLCSVTNKQYITLEEKTFDSKGKLSSIKPILVCVLEWNEKVLII